MKISAATKSGHDLELHIFVFAIIQREFLNSPHPFLANHIQDHFDSLTLELPHRQHHIDNSICEHLNTNAAIQDPPTIREEADHQVHAIIRHKEILQLLNMCG